MQTGVVLPAVKSIFVQRGLWDMYAAPQIWQSFNFLLPERIHVWSNPRIYARK